MYSHYVSPGDWWLDSVNFSASKTNAIFINYAKSSDRKLEGFAEQMRPGLSTHAMIRAPFIFIFLDKKPTIIIHILQLNQWVLATTLFIRRKVAHIGFLWVIRFECWSLVSNCIMLASENRQMKDENVLLRHDTWHCYCRDADWDESPTVPPFDTFSKLVAMAVGLQSPKAEPLWSQ